MDHTMPPTSALDPKPVPPSTLLPPVRKVLELPSAEVSHLVAELSRIYTPEVLGTRFEVATPVRRPASKGTKSTKYPGVSLAPPAVDSGYASLVASDDEGEEDKQQSTALESAVQTLAQDLSSKPKVADAVEEQLAFLRADEFERSCAMKWLTGLIARSAEWVELGAEEENDESSESSEEYQKREKVVEKASALLAACSGSSASGALTRCFTFRPRLSSEVSSSIPIQIHLKDDPLPAQDHTAVGLQTWGSAPILAQLISDRPAVHGLDLFKRFTRNSVGTGSHHHARDDTFKVLELGAGTGLMSLFVWRILEQQLNVARNHADGISFPNCSVFATDYHPSVLSNLNFNLGLNPPSSLGASSTRPSSVSIDSRVLDWNSCAVLDDASRFDIVYGVDIIYEKEHAQLVKSVVEKVLKLPSLTKTVGDEPQGDARHSTGGTFWLIYPLRPTHEVETRSIETVFGEVVDMAKWPENIIGHGQGAGDRGWRLGVLEIQSLQRRKGIGRADEVSYRVLRLGWVAS
ncbi:hypothetical protein M408DRAFT_17578 [Serendipita vermifera MAFF 305830]|uniref:Uncharacterized protein n=1 Tax=Serendipita vermifera MAFF 305830 TaxID=933852 RepID=A0A0C2WD31_SERVB|nr:hypothetical protein M408DRAFT_17578 [Serendipita vermifera MAFF 305830]